eukprot:5179196-Amphidinium_carterae.1
MGWVSPYIPTSATAWRLDSDFEAAWDMPRLPAHDHISGWDAPHSAPRTRSERGLLLTSSSATVVTCRLVGKKTVTHNKQHHER